MEVIGFAITLVFQANRHARVQERQFAQAFCQNLILEIAHVGKGFIAWPETHAGTGDVGITSDRQRCLRYAVDVNLLMHFAFATNGQLQLLRQGVND